MIGEESVVFIELRGVELMSLIGEGFTFTGEDTLPSFEKETAVPFRERSLLAAPFERASIVASLGLDETLSEAERTSSGEEKAVCVEDSDSETSVMEKSETSSSTGL